jgi:predicted nucleotidyltransferase
MLASDANAQPSRWPASGMPDSVCAAVTKVSVPTLDGETRLRPAIDPGVVAACRAVIAARSDAVAVALFGSYARGTATSGLSDVDILVVTEQRLRTRCLREELRQLSPDLSPVFRTSDELAELGRADWSFVEHLRLEHQPLWDPEAALPLLLRPAVPSPRAITQEMDRHLETFRHLDDPEILVGQHLTSYSLLYSCAKSVAILDALRHDEPVFDRAAALRRWGDRRPALRHLADDVALLEPFFLRLRRRRAVKLPWEPIGDVSRLAATVRTVRRFIRASTT